MGIAAVLSSHRHRARRLAKALSISVLNQTVSSGTNFAMGLYLVRALTPADFGIYGIGIAISLFYSGICSALFLTQMVVHTPEKAEVDRQPYAARILAGLMIFCACATLLVFLAVAAEAAWFSSSSLFSRFSLPVLSAAVAYVLKEFFTRYSYTARKEIWALIVNVVVGLSLMCLLLIQGFAEHIFSSEDALWCYAMSNMVGAIAGYSISRLSLRTVNLERVVEDAREAWSGGRWAIGGVSVIWAQSQAYNYITALCLGPAGVGHANAARMLITPFQMLSPAINQVTMPRLAELRLNNLRKMFSTGLSITLVQLFFAILYVVIIVSAAEMIIPIMVGDRYENLLPLVIAWSTILLFQLLRDGAATLLQVMKNFRIIALVNTVSALAAIAFSIILMRSHGIGGAIVGTGIGELLLALMLWLVLLRDGSIVSRNR